VEQVRAPNEGTQQIIYKVDAASEIEGAPAEPFALGSANALELLSNPSVTPTNVARSPGGDVNCSETVELSAQLQNESDDLAASSAQVSLELPGGVELVSGSQTQSVSSGTLDPTETSSTHTWVVRATQSGGHELTIRGQGGTMGETFHASKNVSLRADCSPPKVEPVNVSVRPAGRHQCGVSQTVTAQFRNPSLSDALGARAQIGLPDGVALLEGNAAQDVSAGVLERQTTSEPHTWRLEQRRPVDGATVTGFAQQGDSTAQWPIEILDPCRVFGVGIVGASLRRSAQSLIAKGRVLPERGAELQLQGEVRVRFIKPGRDASRRRPLSETGAFTAMTRACEQGRYVAIARYPGATGFTPARVELGEFRRVAGCT
jgi:hypothetical protein